MVRPRDKRRGLTKTVLQGTVRGGRHHCRMDRLELSEAVRHMDDGEDWFVGHLQRPNGNRDEINCDLSLNHALLCFVYYIYQSIQHHALLFQFVSKSIFYFLLFQHGWLYRIDSFFTIVLIFPKKQLKIFCNFCLSIFVVSFNLSPKYQNLFANSTISHKKQLLMWFHFSFWYYFYLSFTNKIFCNQ